jgi:2-polyprenyl-3-methyl-5-hydroxy-6-metoxy-1,4-benzoquinol methylase
MPAENPDFLLKSQIDYYRARAGEYEEWFYRQGRYDRGPDLNRQWFLEVAAVQSALEAFHATGDILELACGTGIWTHRLVQHAASVTAIDSAPETLSINRDSVRSANIRYVQADIYKWQPDRCYDVVFFGFWLSHVPPERFTTFWRLVARALKPDGRVFLIDSLYETSSTAHDHQLAERDAVSVSRRLNDGRRFDIVKVFYTPDRLSGLLHDLGWRCSINSTPHYFLFGSACRETAISSISRE